MTTVPLGIAGLWLMNAVGAQLPLFGLDAISQPFDMITMLGFLILVGKVVNNPILIVDQALHYLGEGRGVKDAVASRLRPPDGYHHHHIRAGATGFSARRRQRALSWRGRDRFVRPAVRDHGHAGVPARPAHRSAGLAETAATPSADYARTQS